MNLEIRFKSLTPNSPLEIDFQKERRLMMSRAIRRLVRKAKKVQPSKLIKKHRGMITSRHHQCTGRNACVLTSEWLCSSRCDSWLQSQRCHLHSRQSSGPGTPRSPSAAASYGTASWPASIPPANSRPSSTYIHRTQTHHRTQNRTFRTQQLSTDMRQQFGTSAEVPDCNGDKFTYVNAIEMISADD